MLAAESHEAAETAVVLLQSNSDRDDKVIESCHPWIGFLDSARDRP